MNTIRASVQFTPAWFARGYELAAPDPFESSLEELVRYNQEKQRRLYERFGELGLGKADPSAVCPVLLYDRRIIMASAFGDPRLEWDPDTGSYWMDKSYGPWQKYTSAAEIKAIKIPEWEELPLVQHMVRRYEELRRQGTYPLQEDNIEWLEFTWSRPGTRDVIRFHVLANFVDLGAFLCGGTEFFIRLAAEPELSEAMMHKCFEMTISYVDFLRGTFDHPIEGLGGFGGDNCCALSPEMYRKYVLAWDLMLAEAWPGRPVNLHSCGPSAHLYDVWAEYPDREYIMLMQTRGMEGTLGKLRQALPHTHLQITVHAPQFDFENESPERIQQVVRSYAEQADNDKLELVVVVNTPNEQTDRNIRCLYESVDQVHRELLRKKQTIS